MKNLKIVKEESIIKNIIIVELCKMFIQSKNKIVRNYIKENIYLLMYSNTLLEFKQTIINNCIAIGVNEDDLAWNIVKINHWIIEYQKKGRIKLNNNELIIDEDGDISFNIKNILNQEDIMNIIETSTQFMNDKINNMWKKK